MLNKKDNFSIPSSKTIDVILVNRASRARRS